MREGKEGVDDGVFSVVEHMSRGFKMMPRFL